MQHPHKEERIEWLVAYGKRLTDDEPNKENPFQGLSESERLARYHALDSLTDEKLFLRKDYYLPRDADILVVEPDPMLLKFEKALLWSYFSEKKRVDFVKNGMEALACFKAYPHYAAVMLPVDIPLYGLECIADLRQMGYKGLIFLHTSSLHEDAMDTIDEWQMDGYLTKINGITKLLTLFIEEEKRRNKKKQTPS